MIYKKLKHTQRLQNAIPPRPHQTLGSVLLQIHSQVNRLNTLYHIKFTPAP